MTFADASAFVLPFGKYKGQSIDAVAETDEGLRYLDWMRSIDLREPFRTALTTYMNNEAIERDLMTFALCNEDDPSESHTMHDLYGGE